MMDTRVTDFIASYKQPSSHREALDGWNERALEYWLAAAKERGIEASVVEVLDSHHTIAVVEVAGQRYDIAHIGRGMELQAKGAQ
ncbi:hypothetical protein [Nocardia testacea]|uniref:hypothetical protein n=1 Tax=Nocardia testacea TaxID=248551 RepID=UPI00340F8599